MKQFEIWLDDRPGELARVAHALGGAGVNIRAISSDRAPNARPTIRIVTDDERSTTKVLQTEKVDHRSSDILLIRLLDRPGELAKVAKKLARVGVNIESIYIIGKNDGKTEIALTTSNLDASREALRKELE